MTPRMLRLILWGTLAIALALMFRYWLSTRDEKLALTNSVEQGVRTDQAASGIAQDAGVVQQDRAENEAAVYSARNDYQRGYEDAKLNDPTVAPWGARPIPQRLRDLARDRRLSRERSGCDGVGCERDDGAKGQ